MGPSTTARTCCVFMSRSETFLDEAPESEGTFSHLFRNSQLSTLGSTVKSRTDITIITTVRNQGNALTDTFNANRVQCLTLLVHTSTNS